MHREIHGFTEQARNLLQQYLWPGNIRQLANTIERAVILEDDLFVHSANLALPQTVASPLPVEPLPPLIQVESQPGLSAASQAEREKALILHALEDNLWVQKQAARRLGISPRALNYKIKKFKITHPHWRRHRDS